MESIVGTKLNLNYKIKQKKLNNKLKTKCSKLLKFIYKKHKNEVQFVWADCEKWNIFSTLYIYVRFIIKILWRNLNGNYFLILLFTFSIDLSKNLEEKFEDFGFIFHKLWWKIQNFRFFFSKIENFGDKFSRNYGVTVIFFSVLRIKKFWDSKELFFCLKSFCKEQISKK